MTLLLLAIVDGRMLLQSEQKRAIRVGEGKKP